MGITLKNQNEIATMRECGHRLARILKEVSARVKSGVSTGDLDAFAEALIKEAGGVPVFKGYRIEGVSAPYPATLCASINDEVVHGIPRLNRTLRDGDIVGIDIGMRWPGGDAQGVRGMVTDMAVTIGVGNIGESERRLLDQTRYALAMGIAAIVKGARVGDIGFAVEKVLKKNKFGIVRDLAGHGVGHKLHEDPIVPNFGRKGSGTLLVAGMAIAIEPMATLGRRELMIDDDEWTIRTADESTAAHFEQTVAIGEDGRAEILTPFY